MNKLPNISLGNTGQPSQETSSLSKEVAAKLVSNMSALEEVQPGLFDRGSLKNLHDLILEWSRNGTTREYNVAK